MALPAQVQLQLDEAARIEAAINAPAPVPAPAEPSQPEPVAPVPTPPAEPVDPYAQPEASTPAADHRYEVLQGKYNKEVPRLAQEARQLKEQLDAREAEIEALKRSQAEPPQKPEQLVTSKDVDDFGADMVDMVRRVTTDTAIHVLMPRIQKMFSDMESRLIVTENTVGNVAGRQQLSDTDRFYAELTKQVPEWEQVNKSPTWLSWLGQEDDVLGATRQAVLDEASAQLNIRRTVALFKQFLALHTQQAPVETPSSALASQVSPSRATATPAPNQSQENIWTDTAVKAFYRDVSMGKFRGREAEQIQIENDLNAAYSDGRYRRG